jgi:hypothetical protein
MHLLADFLLLLFFTGVLLSPAALPYLCQNPALLQDNTDNPGGTTPISFGCQDVTIPVIGGGSATFTMDAFTLTQFDSDFLTFNNSSGNPNREKGQQKVPEYEITLQHIAGGGSKCPQGFARFNAVDLAGRTLTWKISRVVGAGANDGSATKLTVGARYVLNS